MLPVRGIVGQAKEARLQPNPGVGLEAALLSMLMGGI